ncbi:uncharacterized protein LOC115450046 [Manduca sexta]|uniref:uncharacterized protein LOC115450046 n=1 Tax=Manduca sexta TaxID=7130 RepID=UPI00188F5985|nr:uncharacterized protein LOC115450046 [Manduca sexta]
MNGEQRGFSILTIDEFSQATNVTMYGWQVVGNVTYTNAFLNSIQKLEIRNMIQHVSRWVVDGERVPMASVRGTLFLFDSSYGYDVLFDELDVGLHRFTGSFGYTRTEIVFEIQKNLITNKLSASATLINLSGGYARMVYLPANNITEVLSREFSAITAFESIRNWARNILGPIMLEIAETKVEFPKICFSNSVC